MKTKICLTMAAACLGAAVLNAESVTHYVALDSPNPTPPFLTWATAATNIQQAVDAAAAGDEVVVTNGVYDVGARGPARSTLIPGSSQTDSAVWR